jgi:RHS repeat-associated protein
MVLTDEHQVDPYPVASLEDTSLTQEKLYYQIPDDAGTRVHKQNIAGYPEDGYTNPNDYVHKLNGNGTKVGTSMVLRVMSGDTVHVRANSWYRLNGVTPDQPVSPLNDLLAALAGGISKYTVGKFTQTQLLGSGVLSPSITELLGQQNYSSTKPKAYVNWILFDEQFKFVSNGSGFDQVGADDEFKTHFLSGLQVTKNGYLYIYVSNETPNVDVFFDNLQVTHVRGPLLEETHYYPFGLTMAGISSKAAGKMENKNDKFQGQPLDDDLGLNWYGFKYRNHDPQIGRFIEIDPLANDYVHNSTYAFSENKVTAHVELEGLESVPFGLKDVWRAGGISSSSDPKQFVVNTAKQALKPEAWIQGYAAAGQIAMPFVLTGIMTGGLGGPSILQAETKVLSPRIGLSTALRKETGTVSLASIESRAAAFSFADDVSGVTNPIPSEVARVIPNSVENPSMLGQVGASDVFVTASADIKGLNSTQIAKKLTIPESSSGFQVVTFPTPQGIASPIHRNLPGFVGQGRTAGGAREFVIPNQPIPKEAKIKIVN